LNQQSRIDNHQFILVKIGATQIKSALRTLQFAPAVQQFYRAVRTILARISFGFRSALRKSSAAVRAAVSLP
jgi:hypothetical protein